MESHSLTLILNCEVSSLLNEHSHHAAQSIVTRVMERSVAFFILSVDATRLVLQKDFDEAL